MSTTAFSVNMGNLSEFAYISILSPSNGEMVIGTLSLKESLYQSTVL